MSHLESAAGSAHVLIIGKPNGIGQIVRSFAREEGKWLVYVAFVALRPDYAFEVGLPWTASFLNRIGFWYVCWATTVRAEKPALLVAVIM